MENGCVEKKKDLVGWVQAEWQACRHECGIKKVREWGGSLVKVKRRCVDDANIRLYVRSLKVRSKFGLALRV
jgi:hypothetical protein